MNRTGNSHGNPNDSYDRETLGSPGRIETAICGDAPPPRSRAIFLGDMIRCSGIHHPIRNRAKPLESSRGSVQHRSPGAGNPEGGRHQASHALRQRSSERKRGRRDGKRIEFRGAAIGSCRLVEGMPKGDGRTCRCLGFGRFGGIVFSYFSLHWRNSSWNSA